MILVSELFFWTLSGLIAAFIGCAIYGIVTGSTLKPAEPVEDDGSIDRKSIYL